jgi:hypothetical protein
VVTPQNIDRPLLIVPIRFNLSLRFQQSSRSGEGDSTVGAIGSQARQLRTGELSRPVVPLMRNFEITGDEFDGALDVVNVRHLVDGVAVARRD